MFDSPNNSVKFNNLRFSNKESKPSLEKITSNHTDNQDLESEESVLEQIPT